MKQVIIWQLLDHALAAVIVTRLAFDCLIKDLSFDCEWSITSFALLLFFLILILALIAAFYESRMIIGKKAI